MRLARRTDHPVTSWRKTSPKKPTRNPRRSATGGPGQALGRPRHGHLWLHRADLDRRVLHAQRLPPLVDDLGGWNLVVGMGFIVAAFGFAMKWE